MLQYTAVVSSLAHTSWLLILCAGCGRLGFDSQASPVDATLELPDAMVETPDAGMPAFQPVAHGSYEVVPGVGDFEVVQDVAVDEQGNIYVAGSFQDLRMGDVDLRSQGANDAFIASFDRELDPRWIRALGGAGTDAAIRLFWNGDRLYSQLFYEGTINDLGIDVSAAGQDDHLLMSLSREGQIFDWASFGSPGDDDFGRALYTTNSGAVLTGGGCAGGFDYGGGVLTGDGSLDPCLAVLGQDFAHVASKRYLGPEKDALRAISQFPNGDVLQVGGFSDRLAIHSTMLTAKGEDDVFLIRSSLDGAGVWVQQLGGAGNEVPEHAVIDELGNIYVAMSSTSTLIQTDGQSVTLDGVGGADALLVSFDKGGDFRWATALMGRGFETFQDVALLPDGHVAVVGGFVGPALFGGREVGAVDAGMDMFVAVIDSDGTPVWWHANGTSSEDSFMAVAAAWDGAIVAVGYAGGQVDFGLGPVGPSNPAVRGVLAHLDYR